MRLIKRIIVWLIFFLALAYCFAGPDVLKNAYGAAASGDVKGAFVDIYGNTVTGISHSWNNLLKTLPVIPAAPAAFSADRAIVWAGSVKARRLLRKAVRLAVASIVIYLGIRFIPWAIVLGWLSTMM